MSQIFALVVYVMGRNAFRFINLCLNNRIKMRKISKQEEGYFVTVDARQFRQMKPLARKSNVKIRILNKKGIYFRLLRKTYFKKGVFILTILCMLLYSARFFVWKIEVVGNGQLSEDVICDWLKDHGVYKGCLISKVDVQRLEDELRIEMPQVAWDSIAIQNQTILLHMKEVLEPTLPKEPAKCMDYVASEDAIVSEIVTRSGTRLVENGQEVKKGDLLVSGKVEVLNDAGELVSYLYEGADADIYGYVTCERTLWIPYEAQICLRKEANTLSFFQNKRNQVYYENVIYDEQGIARYADEKIMEFLFEMEENGMRIADKNVIIDKIGDLYQIRLELKGTKSIVDEVPTEYIEVEREGTVVDEFE